MRVIHQATSGQPLLIPDPIPSTSKEEEKTEEATPVPSAAPVPDDTTEGAQEPPKKKAKGTGKKSSKKTAYRRISPQFVDPSKVVTSDLSLEEVKIPRDYPRVWPPALKCINMGWGKGKRVYHCQVENCSVTPSKNDQAWYHVASEHTGLWARCVACRGTYQNPESMRCHMREKHGYQGYILADEDEDDDDTVSK
jgi:hypothetical protein